MQNIKKTSDLVKHVLQTVPEARSCNNVLYYHVCKEANSEVLKVPFGVAITDLQLYNIPCFETVTRARRKLQSIYPELAANEEVECFRELEEEKYKNYAKAVNL